MDFFQFLMAYLHWTGPGQEPAWNKWVLWNCSFHITPEPGYGPRPIVALYFGVGPCFCLGP